MKQKTINNENYKDLQKKGEQLRVADKYDEALKLYNQALPLCEKAVGKIHMNTADLYNKLGVVYMDMGNFNTSKKWLNKAFEIYKELGEDKGLEIAFVYNNLGVLNSNRGNYTNSIKYYSLAKEIREKIHGPNHKDTLLVNFNLSTTYIHTEQYNNALELLQNSYKILRKKFFDSNKYQYASTCNSIGLIYRKQGDSDTALKWYFRAIKISKKSIKTTKSLLITIYGNISAIYRDRGEYSTSMEYQKKALEYINILHSDTHPKAGNIYAEMGSVNYRQKNYDKAIEFALKVISIRESTLGVNHHDTALAYSNAGIYYFSKNDFSNAIKYYKKSTDSYYSCYGDKSQKYLTILGELAKSYFRNEEYEQSASAYENLLAIRITQKDNTKANTLNLNYNIARCYENLADKSSINRYEKCISISEELYGENDSRTINIMSFLARTHFKIKQYDNSIYWYDKIIEITKKNSEINYNFLLDMYLNKITVYKTIEKIKEAIDTNIEAQSYFDENAPNNIDTLSLTYNLGFLYSKNQDFSNAIKQFEDSISQMKKRVYEGSDTGNEYIYAQIYREMAHIYLNVYTNYISSITYFEKCILIHKANYGNDINLAQMYRDIAFPYFRLSEYDRAEEYCLAALEILLDKFDETHEGVIEINNILNRIHSEKSADTNSADSQPSFFQ